MNNFFAIFGRLVAGVILGSFFFGGLWWTVEKRLTSNNPALWFFGSALLRTGVALAGFYFIARGSWVNILVCLLGFSIARLVVILSTRPSNERPRAT